jgi:hypothetical protein
MEKVAGMIIMCTAIGDPTDARAEHVADSFRAKQLSAV